MGVYVMISCLMWLHYSIQLRFMLPLYWHNNYTSRELTSLYADFPGIIVIATLRLPILIGVFPGNKEGSPYRKPINFQWSKPLSLWLESKPCQLPCIIGVCIGLIMVPILFQESIFSCKLLDQKQSMHSLVISEWPSSIA